MTALAYGNQLVCLLESGLKAGGLAEGDHGVRHTMEGNNRRADFLQKLVDREMIMQHSMNRVNREIMGN